MGSIKCNFCRPRDWCSHHFSLFLLISIYATFTFTAPSRRSVIFEDFTDRQERINKSSNLMSCITTFIYKHYEGPERISLLIPNVRHDISYNLVKPLTEDLYRESTIYVLQIDMMDNITEIDDIPANVFIFLSENISVFEGQEFCPINYCRYDCDIMIMLTNLYIDEESFLAETNMLIDQICQRSAFKVTISAMVGDSVLFTESLPNEATELLQVDTIIFAKCKNKVLSMKRQHFGDASPNIDVVDVAMFENFPYALMENTTTNCTFGGVEGLMIEEMFGTVPNIILNREVIPLNTNVTIVQELESRLDNSMKSDIIFGGLLWNTSRKTEYSSSYGMVRIVWLVPFETNVSLEGLVTPFRANVWYAIIGTLIIGGLVKLFFIRDISFLDITGLVIGTSVNRQPVKNSSRIQFLAWTLFGFFLTQLYLGSLADQLINSSNHKMNTLEELLTSDIKIGGNSRFMKLLNIYDSSDRGIFEMLSERLFVFDYDTYTRQVSDLIAGRNTSFALIVTLNLSDIGKSDVGNAHIMEEHMGTYPLALATWRGFPYLKDINFNILLFLEAGIVQYWLDEVTISEKYNEEIIETNQTTIDIKDLTPAFLLLIIGYLGGFCLLIIEVIFYPSPYLL